MVGGVFDRYPDLKCVATEIHADWVPATLAALDRRFEQGDTPMRMRPSEYWRRNFFACVSLLRRAEVEMRAEVGVAQMLFGRDYPHPEGMWPNTMDWIRDAFRGVPEHEVAMILSDNAIRCYGLDRDRLESVARRIGPRREDLFGAGRVVDPRLIETFNKRGGYDKPAESVDLAALEQYLTEDLSGLAKV
jgi:hypothetical protein